MKKLSITTLAILTILAVLASVGVTANFDNPVADADLQPINAFEPFTFNLNAQQHFAHDGLELPLTYRLDDANPVAGLDCAQFACPSVDTNSGIISWTPRRDSLGVGNNDRFTIRVIAREPDGNEQPFEINVKVNPRLTITNNPATSLKTDLTNNNGVYDYDFAVQFSNDLAQLRYAFRRVDAQIENRLNPVDLNQGRVRWTPTQAEAGTRDFRVEVTDARANGVAAQSKQFSLTVEGAILTVGTAQIGDANTKRTNPQSSLAADHNRTGSAAITISNTGDLPLRVGDVVITIAQEQDAQPPASQSYVDQILRGFRDAQEEARVEALTLNPGTGNAINVKANIVSNFPAVDPITYVARAFKIGTISVLNEETNQPIVVDLKMQAENKLEIDDVEVCKGLEGSEKCEKPSNGDTVDEVKPFETLSVAVTLENKYQDEDEDPAIEDVIVEVSSTAADLDINDDNEETDIDVDEAETFSDATIEIEDDADGTSKVKVVAFGRDENGALHGATQEFSVKIERTSHEIDIATARLNPALVSCTPGNRNVQVDAELRNIGKKKEKDVKVEARVERSGLNVLKSESDIEMDKNDEHRSLLTFAVPEMVPPGVYPVEVKSFTDRNQLSDSETVMLTVPDCGFLPASAPEGDEKEEGGDEEKKEDVVVTTPTAGTATTGTTGTVATATPVAKKAAKTFTASNAYIGALAAIIVVLLVIGGILVAMIVRKQ